MYLARLFLTAVLMMTAFSASAMEQPLLILSGNASAELGASVAEELDIVPSKALISTFNDGEIRIQILENVRNRDVFVIQSTSPTKERSINDNLMELYFLVRTLKRSSANTITAVIPYYGYARQDRKMEPRVPISASDVAMLLESSGVDRVISVDLHCGQIQGFFRNIPVDNLYASTVFVPYFAKKQLDNLVVVSPDAGGVDRAKHFMEKLAREGVESDLAIIIKQRAQAGVVDKMNLVGNVTGSDVVIVDDLCDTGGTLIKAAEMLVENGARRVFAAITHPVFSGPALERIKNSVFTEVVVTDSIMLKDQEIPQNITCISIAPLLAEAIRRNYSGESVSALF